MHVWRNRLDWLYVRSPADIVLICQFSRKSSFQSGRVNSVCCLSLINPADDAAGSYAVKTERRRRPETHQCQPGSSHTSGTELMSCHTSPALIVHCSTLVMCRSHLACFTITSAVCLQGTKLWKWAKWFYVPQVRLPLGWQPKEESNPLSGGPNVWKYRDSRANVQRRGLHNGEGGEDALVMESVGSNTEIVNIVYVKTTLLTEESAVQLLV